MSLIESIQPRALKTLIRSHIVRLLFFKEKGTLLRGKICVGIHDTLVTIAEQHCHDPSLAWLIADQNQTRLKQTFVESKRIVEIRRGQQLELPSIDDIERFYSNRPKNAVTENLITIVVRNETDVDLIEFYLASLLSNHALDT